jgi:hypothetical protein
MAIRQLPRKLGHRYARLACSTASETFSTDARFVYMPTLKGSLQDRRTSPVTTAAMLRAANEVYTSTYVHHCTCHTL